MGEMYDSDTECDKCGGPGPPPKFTIPPPPRPPHLIQYQQEVTNCIDVERLDLNMCEAIPILDASYHSSPSLQTSAMIAVFSLLLVLVVLISSLFVWKHKRKVQNFLPCKTQSRGSHLRGAVAGGHSVTYEDPDAHLGHRPLVVRHHHNVEMLPSKTIHYPSGYPIAKSPPLFVCSSPGPDPYRSNDNVYEELGPGRDSGGESDPPLNSDDDFAEDELSLPGDSTFNKNQPEISTIPVSTIYHERINTNNTVIERNTIVSSTSTSSTTGNNDQRTGLLSGVIRQASNSCGRRIHHHNNISSISNSNSNSNNNNSNSNNNNKNSNRKPSNISVSDIHTFNQSGVTDIVPTVYDERNLMTLPLNNHHHHHHHNHQHNHNQQQQQQQQQHLQLNNINNTFSYCNNSNNTNNRLQCLATSTPGLLIESEVERRNRINNQLHHPPVSTVFRDRINYGAVGGGGIGGGSIGGGTTNGGSNNHPQPYYSHHNLLGSQRLRTNPRSLDRRRIGIPIEYETTYGYAEPVFHEGLLYDACLAHTNSTNTNSLRNPTYPYMLPEFTTFRTLGNTPHHHIQQQQQHRQPQLTTTPNQHPQSEIYSRDSSFGSDSGYSHHTQTSTRGGGGTGSGGGVASSINSAGSNGCGRYSSSSNSNSNNNTNPVGKLANLSFSWNRSSTNKANTSKTPNTQSNTSKNQTKSNFEQS